MSGFVQKLKDIWTPPEDEYLDDGVEQNEFIEQEQVRINDRRHSKQVNVSKKVDRNEKIVNIHTNSNFQVVLFKPERFGEETRAVADEFLKAHTIVLNLENTNKDVSRRILDFLSGVAYANGGKIKRVASETFVMTPYNVGFEGTDMLDEVSSNGVYF